MYSFNNMFFELPPLSDGSREKAMVSKVGDSEKMDFDVSKSNSQVTGNSS